ncbi:MAG TPA: hypothetical protein VIN40_05310 [Candidatus Tyrphobacter sp.]
MNAPMKNVDAKREKEAQIERIATAIAAAVAVVIALRKLFQTLSELAR